MPAGSHPIRIQLHGFLMAPMRSCFSSAPGAAGAHKHTSSAKETSEAVPH